MSSYRPMVLSNKTLSCCPNQTSPHKRSTLHLHLMILDIRFDCIKSQSICTPKGNNIRVPLECNVHELVVWTKCKPGSLSGISSTANNGEEVPICVPTVDITIRTSILTKV